MDPETPFYPPHPPVSASEARERDLAALRDHGLPTLVLMEHAGRGVALLAARLRATAGPGPVVVLAGPGNNGGDGYACARFLASFDVPVRVVRVAPTEPTGADARLEHALSRAAAGEPVVVASEGDLPRLDEALAGASVIVDALFGIGLARPLGAFHRAVIARVNAAPALRLAVDVPSGMEADSGEPLPVAVRADVTAALGARKLGCLTPAGAPYAGRLVEVDIGLPPPHRRPSIRS